MQSRASITELISNLRKIDLRRLLALGTFCLLGFAVAPAADNTKPPAAGLVDSGSFAIFQDGHQVATETFSIHQSTTGSVATSEFKMEPSVGNADQSFELELSAAGDLQRYEWKERSPGKASALVTPKDEFLIARYWDTPDAKPKEQPFLLSTSTVILDDYFFIQREILAWKFLSTACSRDKDGALSCPLKQEVKLGILNPRLRASMSVSLAFQGNDKVTIHGAERELPRINLKSEDSEWSMWLDEQFKVIRIVVPGDKTEVVRN